MKIIVPIKQVPETSNVKMDPETGTVIRTGVETVVNPLDLYAVETALALKQKYGGTVVAVTMGPPQAVKALKEAVAKERLHQRGFGRDKLGCRELLVELVQEIGLLVGGHAVFSGKVEYDAPLMRDVIFRDLRGGQSAED